MNKDILASFIEKESKEPSCQCIVRLTTTYWYDPDGVYKKQTIRFLKRKCIGFNILYEDASNIGANEVVPRITNLDECKDGIYKIVTCNEFTCWETPHVIEDYDYKLLPIE